jgi:tRNA G18 (ribose-2'-O)-methylase SpoU
MRLSDLLCDLYQSFISEDWVNAENLLEKYFSIIDDSSNDKSYLNDYSVGVKYESLFAYNYSLSCFHLKKYEKAIESFKKANKFPLIVILDNVRSMSNVGSIFRTCDGFAVETFGWLYAANQAWQSEAIAPKKLNPQPV